MNFLNNEQIKSKTIEKETIKIYFKKNIINFQKVKLFQIFLIMNYII